MPGGSSFALLALMGCEHALAAGLGAVLFACVMLVFRRTLRESDFEDESLEDEESLDASDADVVISA